MFCENCGKEIDDGRRFCDACEPLQSIDETMPPEQPVIDLNCEGAPEEKKRFNWKLLAIIGTVITALAVLVVFLWKPWSKSQEKGQKFSTAQEHFAYVEGNAAQNMADAIAIAYGDYMADYDVESGSVSMEFHLQFNEFILNVLGSSLEMDISWLKDIAMKLDISGDENIAQLTATLGIGETDILGIDFILDQLNERYFYGLPQINDTYVVMDGYMEEDIPLPEADFNSQEMLAGLLEYMPSEQLVQQLLSRYFAVVVSNITDVTRTNSTLSIAGVTQECTVLEAKIDYNTAYKIVKSILEEAKHDQDLKNMICEIVSYIDPEMGQDLTESWADHIDDLIDQLEEPDQEYDSDFILWTVYVDKNNQVIGRELNGTMDEFEDLAISYIKVSEGNTFGVEICLGDQVSIVGSGVASGKTTNAKYQLKISGVSMAEIEFTNIDTEQAAKGNFRGTVLIRPSDEVMVMLIGAPQLDIALSVTVRNDEDPISIDLLIDGQSVATLTAEWKQNAFEPIEIPENAVDAMDEQAFEQWLEGIDVTKVLDNLLEAGVPMEFIESIAGAIVGAAESV